MFHFIINNFSLIVNCSIYFSLSRLRTIIWKETEQTDGYRSAVCLFYATLEVLTPLTLKVILFKQNITRQQEKDLMSDGEKAGIQYQNMNFPKRSHNRK